MYIFIQIDLKKMNRNKLRVCNLVIESESRNPNYESNVPIAYKRVKIVFVQSNDQDSGQK